MKYKLIVLLVMVILTSYGPATVNTDSMLGSGSAYSSGDQPSDNITLTCAERNIEGSDTSLYSKVWTNVIKAFRIIYFTVTFITGVPLNCFVFYLVVKYKKLHTLSFGIVLQVVVLNLLFSIFVFLPIVVTAAANKWVFGTEVCVITGFVAFTVLMVRTALLFVFVIDRFLSVFFPYFYPKHKVKITVGLSVMSWVVILVLNSLAFPGILDCYTFIPSAEFCNISVSCSRTCSFFGSFYFTVLGLPSTITPVFLYGSLYLKAKRLRKNTAAPVVTNPTTGVAVSDEARKREWRATITFFLLFVSVFAITIPSTAIGIVISRISTEVELAPIWFFVQAVFGATSSLIVLTDPLVLMRNRDVREIVSQVKASLVRKCCPKCLPSANEQ